MTKAKQKILENIRQKRTTSTYTALPIQTLLSRLAHLTPDAKRKMFIENAEYAKATIHQMTLDALPILLKELCARHQITEEIVVAPQLQDLKVGRVGGADIKTQLAITEAAFGIAETGTLALLANEHTPNTLLFLPAVSVVLLSKNNIVMFYEEAWEAIKKMPTPRAVNFVTGPSRTGDIEQKIEIGIHGPKYLEIVVY